jgi:hypothetical protein
MRAGSRDVPQTSWPLAVSILAIANPIPELAPVRKIFIVRRSFHHEIT